MLDFRGSVGSIANSTVKIENGEGSLSCATNGYSINPSKKFTIKVNDPLMARFLAECFLHMADRLEGK